MSVDVLFELGAARFDRDAILLDWLARETDTSAVRSALAERRQADPGQSDVEHARAVLFNRKLVRDGFGPVRVFEPVFLMFGQVGNTSLRVTGSSALVREWVLLANPGSHLEVMQSVCRTIAPSFECGSTRFSSGGTPEGFLRKARRALAAATGPVSAGLTVPVGAPVLLDAPPPDRIEVFKAWAGRVRHARFEMQPSYRREREQIPVIHLDVCRPADLVEVLDLMGLSAGECGRMSLTSGHCAPAPVREASPAQDQAVTCA